MTTAVSAALDGLPSVTLGDIDDVAARARYDRKYLIAMPAVADALASLGERFGVLDIDGRRTFDYLSVYFDTSDLATFQMHRQGRRRRYKIRTRHYGDADATMLEVKCKSPRGQTIKYRRPHTGASPFELDEPGWRYVAATLRHHYGLDVDLAKLGPLDWTLETTFRRSTLADLDAGERVTIDQDLGVRSPTEQFVFNNEWAIIEAKSATRRSVSGRALRTAGAREDRLSKYCLGIAAVNPEITANPWRRSLRTLSDQEAIAA